MGILRKIFRDNMAFNGFESWDTMFLMSVGHNVCILFADLHIKKKLSYICRTLF